MSVQINNDKIYDWLAAVGGLVTLSAAYRSIRRERNNTALKTINSICGTNLTDKQLQRLTESDIWERSILARNSGREMINYLLRSAPKILLVPLGFDLSLMGIDNVISSNVYLKKASSHLGSSLIPLILIDVAMLFALGGSAVYRGIDPKAVTAGFCAEARAIEDEAAAREMSESRVWEEGERIREMLPPGFVFVPGLIGIPAPIIAPVPAVVF